MAQKRMFSRKITESDAFTNMPLSAQCLYFHIGMAADDDGFVDGVNRIRRSIGAAEDDLKLLIAKSFLIPFESGVVVVRQWHIHNYIQKDRYTPTAHVDEMARLVVLGEGEVGAYAIRSQQLEIADVSAMDTECIHSVSTMDTKRIQGVSEMDTRCTQNVSPDKELDLEGDTARGKGECTPSNTARALSSRNKKNNKHTATNEDAQASARDTDTSGFLEKRLNIGDCDLAYNTAWKNSPRARDATAQNIIDKAQAERLPVCNLPNLHKLLTEAMENGVTPEELLEAARKLDDFDFGVWQFKMVDRRRHVRQDRLNSDNHAQEIRRRAAELLSGQDKSRDEMLRTAYD